MVHVVLVRVCGELDAGTVPRLAAVLGELEGRHCEVDLVGVSFMDSAGVALLLGHRRHAGAAEASLRVVGVSLAVRRILDLTGTTAVLLAAPGPP